MQQRVSQIPSVLAASASAGLLALSGIAAEHGLLHLPDDVGPQGLILTAALYGIATCVSFVVALLVPLSRLAFCAACVATTLFFHVIFFVLGNVLATDGELAVHVQILCFFATSVGLCGLTAWPLSLVAAKHLRFRGRVTS